MYRVKCLGKHLTYAAPSSAYLSVALIYICHKCHRGIRANNIYHLYLFLSAMSAIMASEGIKYINFTYLYLTSECHHGINNIYHLYYF